MGIGSSPTVGKTCATCLQEFTIHFRRIEDSVYDGSYGFDWYRPEFYEKLTSYKGVESAKGVDKVALVSGSLAALKNTYTNGQKTPIRPYKEEYIPAWLAIHSTEWLNAHRVDDDNKKYNVSLDLELIPIKNEGFLLNNNGTIIKFKPSNPNITIEPLEIDIGNFFYDPRNNRNLPKQGNKNNYFLSNAVNITCISALENHEEILVYAEKNGKEEIVGQLMIYHNSVVPTISIQMIYFKIDKEIFKPDGNYRNFLKYRAFNQALINVDFKSDIELDIIDIKTSDKSEKLKTSLKRLKNKDENAYFLDDMNNIYQYYYKNGKYDNYVFLTTVNKGTTAGVADEGNRKVIMFKKAETNFNQILTHELAHRYGLAHLFEPQKISLKGESFQFLQGTTSNFLDYDYKELKDEEKNNPKKSNKPKHRAIANFNFSLNYFFKYQWDLLRKRVK